VSGPAPACENTLWVKEKEFRRVVEETIAEMPAAFRKRLAGVTVAIRSRPLARELREAGVPASERETLFGFYSEEPPARIVLYRRNLEESYPARRDLVREIRKTILHEVGHTLGMEEEDLDRLGYG